MNFQNHIGSAVRSRRQSIAANWPFCLLIVAWFCANIPATVPLQVGAWLKGAEHFSHYAALRQSTAALLAGQTHATAPRLASAEQDDAHHSPTPILPTGTDLKKKDLDPSIESFRLIASKQTLVHHRWTMPVPDAPVADVPYPPPRIHRLA